MPSITDDAHTACRLEAIQGGTFFFLNSYFVQVSQLRELIEVKEVITPYGRSGS